MAYEDFKDIARRTASDKVLGDKSFDIAKNHDFGIEKCINRKIR